MRHLVSGRKLGRDTNSRKALSSNLASSLLVEGHITTTLAKAKFVRNFVEKLITDARGTSLHQKRTVASRLTHAAFIKLITQIGPGFADRQGGYVRIIKLSERRGDSAPMAKIEILEWDKSKAQPLAKNQKTAKSVKTKVKPQPKEVVKKNINEKPNK